MSRSPLRNLKVIRKHQKFDQNSDVNVDREEIASNLNAPQQAEKNREMEMQDEQERGEQGNRKSRKGKLKADNNNMPSIDELLTPDLEKEKEEACLDELDKLIAERKEKHERESAKVQADIAAERLRQEERRKRLAENAKLRDRLEREITEEQLRKLFDSNREYFEGIWNGKIESARHNAFHQSRQSRHALTYKMITDPFTDGNP